MMKKLDKKMTLLIIQVQFTPKTNLSCCDWLHRILYVTKTRKDNDVTNRIGAIYDENNIELSLPIGMGADYDEN